MVHPTIDEFSAKKELAQTQIEWIAKHEIETKRWLQKNLKEADWEQFLHGAVENPYAYKRMIEQSLKSNTDRQRTIVDKIGGEYGRIDLIVGGKGSGKTALAYWIAEHVYNEYDRPIYWFGTPTELPDFFNVTLDLNEVPKGALILIDEASVQHNARETQHGTQQSTMKKLPVIRHKSKNALVISQSTSLTDLAYVSLADGIFFKEYQVFQDQTERDVTMNEELKMFMPTKETQCLYYDNEDIIFFRHRLADCWKEAYSTPYGQFDNRGELYRFAVELMQWYEDDERIIQQADLRDATLEEITVMRLRMLRETKGADTLSDMSDRELAQLVDKGMTDAPINDLQDDSYDPDREYDFEFEMVEDRKEMWRRRLQGNSELQLYAKRNYNQNMLNSIRQRHKRNKNVVLSVYGQQGGGKSYTAISLAQVIARVFDRDPFDAIHIYFNSQQIVEDIDDMGKGDVVIQDEQTRGQGTGSAASEERLANLEDTLREEQINFIFVSPQLKTHTHYFYLRPMGIDYDRGVSRNFVYTGEHNPMGYITLRKPDRKIIGDPDNPAEGTYNYRKNEFTDRVKEGDANKKEYIEQRAKEALCDDDFHMMRTKDQRLTELEKKNPDLASGEIKNVYNEANKLFYKETGAWLEEKDEANVGATPKDFERKFFDDEPDTKDKILQEVS